jgi:hypothetical protein
VERARAGDGPTLIECVTYRLEIHTTADDPTRYRDGEEVEKWRKRDPILRVQRYLVERGLLSDDRIGQLEEEIKKQIEDAWRKAQQQMEELQDLRVMFKHIYAEMPPHLPFYVLADEDGVGIVSILAIFVRPCRDIVVVILRVITVGNCGWRRFDLTDGAGRRRRQQGL